jgi:hypothetical protein
MWKEKVEAAIEQYNGDDDEEALAAVLRPWISERLSQRVWSGKYGGGKEEKIEEILTEMLAFLEGPDTIGCPNIYKTLNGIIIHDAPIKHLNLISIDRPGKTKDEDEASEIQIADPTATEDAVIEKFEPGSNPNVMPTDEVLAFMDKWQKQKEELEKAVSERKGGLWDFVRSLDRKHFLWEILRACGKERLSEFAELIYKMAGQRNLYFPEKSTFENALAKAKIKEKYLDQRPSFPELVNIFHEHWGLQMTPDRIRKIYEKVEREQPAGPEKRNIMVVFLARIYDMSAMIKKKK